MDRNMQQYHMVFRRREQKYLLTVEQYHRLWEKIAPHLVRDEYAHSVICNLYYDTEDYELIRSSIEKPAYKEKLRLRSYGVPEEDTIVFIEMKKKYQGIVYKRRAGLTLADASAGLEQGYIVPIMGQEQVLSEINYFLQRYPLRPSVFLAYDRDAFHEEGNPELRVTFDAAIRSRRECLDLKAGTEGEEFFQNGEVMMEIKTASAYPFWLIRAIEECRIYPTSFSKYGSIYQQCLLPEFLEERRSKSVSMSV